MTPLETDELTTRRRLILGIGIGGTAAALGFASSALSDDDKDDDDDHDNSGPGNGDDDNDDHSGHGGDDDDRIVVTDEIPAGSSEVRIVEDDPDGFQPGTVTIYPGQTVTFVNAHDDPHTATGGSFDTGILQPGDISTITFDEPGTFPYACQIHPEMTGTVEVLGATGTPVVATPAAGSSTGALAVTIENLEFHPPELSVRSGSTVTWTNDDTMTHTATSLDGAFDTGNLAQGQSTSITFDQPGQFAYQCSIHTGMKGTVVVE